MKDHVGSSNQNDETESEGDDEDNELVLIDKTKKCSCSKELAGLDGTLGSTWEPPLRDHSQISHMFHHQRRSWQEVDHAGDNCPVQAEDLWIMLQIRCDFSVWDYAIFCLLRQLSFQGSCGLAITLVKLWASPITWEEVRIVYICMYSARSSDSRDTMREMGRLDCAYGHY